MGMRGVERVTAREGRLHPSIQLILSTSSSDQLSIVDERSCRYSRSGQRQVSGVHTEAAKFPTESAKFPTEAAKNAPKPQKCTPKPHFANLQKETITVTLWISSDTG